MARLVRLPCVTSRKVPSTASATQASSPRGGLLRVRSAVQPTMTTGMRYWRNRAGRGVAELDGGEVGVLDAEHAEDGEGNRLEAVAPPAEDGEDVLPVDGEVDEQQQGARDEHAHADEPFRRKGAVLKDVLASDARAAPEDGSCQGECDAAAAHACRRPRCMACMVGTVGRS